MGQNIGFILKHKKGMIAGGVSLCALLLVAIFLYFFVTHFWGPPSLFPPPHEIVTGDEIHSELHRMNRIDTSQTVEFYYLDYARDDLIVLHNSMYMVVLEKTADEWAVTALLNPDATQCFWIQGSIHTFVTVDETARYIAIKTKDIYPETVPSPLYVFNIETKKLETREDDSLPADFVEPTDQRLQLHSGSYAYPAGNGRYCAYDSKNNRMVFFAEDGTETSTVPLAKEPDRSVYVLDEDTLVYMTRGFGTTMGSYRLCFQDIPTGKVTQLKIQ